MREPVLRPYRMLLLLLPRALRRQFGADMEATFRERLVAARSTRVRAWIWTRGIADILTQAVLDRIRGAHHGTKEMGGGTATIGQEAGWAIRHLSRSWLISAIAMLTLALGIATSTATFSVVDAVLLKELPYHDARRLVVVWPETTFNTAMVADVTAKVPALESVTGVAPWNLTLTGVADPLEVRANRVSPSHFSLLGATPELGRGFEPGDGLPGAPPVVILSHGFWMRVFGGDPGVIGRTISLSGPEANTRTVVGVMPGSFRPVSGRPEVWVPLTHDPSVPPAQDGTWYVNLKIGRLAAGATVEQAQRELRRYAVDLRRQLRLLPEEQVASASIRPLQQYVTRAVGPILWATLGAVALVLLIACANVANLMLAKGEAREQEIAIRAALGASRRGVARMLLTESAVLGGLGGGLGVALSYPLLHTMLAFAPSSLPHLDEVRLNGGVLIFALGVTVFSTLASAILPVLRLSRVDAIASVGHGSRGAGRRLGSRWSRVLVGAEMSLALIVVVGATLMLRSLTKLKAVDTGLDARGVLVLRPAPPTSRYSDAAASLAYNQAVLERVAALPGIERAGGVDLLPGTQDNSSFPTWPEGLDPSDRAQVPFVNFRIVTPGYFATVGIGVKQGRDFTSADDATSQKVMVVNQAFVNRFWSGLEPIGKSVRTLRKDGDRYTVVGVVGDVRQAGLAEAPAPAMYVTQPQWGGSHRLWVVARVARGSPLDQAAAARQAIWSVDADVPIPEVSTLEAVFDQSAETTRFLTLVLSAFAGMALFLGSIGVFGVTTFTVRRRLPEFGVRIALGSSRAGVVQVAMSTCLLPVTVGLAVGLAGAMVASAALRSVLYGVGARDPATFLLALAVLFAVAMLGALLPGLRGSRVDPSTALNER